MAVVSLQFRAFLALFYFGAKGIAYSSLMFGVTPLYISVLKASPTQLQLATVLMALPWATKGLWAAVSDSFPLRIRVRWVGGGVRAIFGLRSKGGDDTPSNPPYPSPKFYKRYYIVSSLAVAAVSMVLLSLSTTVEASLVWLALASSGFAVADILTEGAWAELGGSDEHGYELALLHTSDTSDTSDTSVTSDIQTSVTSDTSVTSRTGHNPKTKKNNHPTNHTNTLTLSNWAPRNISSFVWGACASGMAVGAIVAGVAAPDHLMTAFMVVSVFPGAAALLVAVSPNVIPNDTVFYSNSNSYKALQNPLLEGDNTYYNDENSNPNTTVSNNSDNDNINNSPSLPVSPSLLNLAHHPRADFKIAAFLCLSCVSLLGLSVAFYNGVISGGVALGLTIVIVILFCWLLHCLSSGTDLPMTGHTQQAPRNEGGLGLGSPLP